MSPLMLLLSLAAVDIAAIASPGPAILLVMQSAVQHGRKQALLCMLGITAASAIWAGVALTGLTMLFELAPSLQTVLRVVGAGFLIWLGIMLWRTPAAQPAMPETPAAARMLLRGFATGMLNPKALTYFATIFVLFVPADTAVEWRLASWGVVAVNHVLVLGLASVLFSTEAVRKAYLALRRPIDRICGAILTAFGARLLLMRN
jgi:threonine efflux protein